MHKNATKCNETIGKWCKNKHRASKIIDTFETYHFLLGFPTGRWKAINTVPHHRSQSKAWTRRPINCLELSRSSRASPSGVLSFSYWIDYLGFITEGILAAIFIKPFLGVSNWPVILLHQQTQTSFLASSSPRHHRLHQSFEFTKERPPKKTLLQHPWEVHAGLCQTVDPLYRRWQHWH
jgi:hypothetical protein